MSPAESAPMSAADPVYGMTNSTAPVVAVHDAPGAAEHQPPSAVTPSTSVSVRFTLTWNLMTIVGAALSGWGLILLINAFVYWGKAGGGINAAWFFVWIMAPIFCISIGVLYILCGQYVAKGRAAADKLKRWVMISGVVGISGAFVTILTAGIVHGEWNEMLNRGSRPIAGEVCRSAVCYDDTRGWNIALNVISIMAMLATSGYLAYYYYINFSAASKAGNSDAEKQPIVGALQQPSMDHQSEAESASAAAAESSGSGPADLV